MHYRVTVGLTSEYAAPSASELLCGLKGHSTQGRGHRGVLEDGVVGDLDTVATRKETLPGSSTMAQGLRASAQLRQVQM